MNGPPRIALFADTFHEVNGAARTCREWEAFARRRDVPFLCVRWGMGVASCEEGPSAWTLELLRSRLSVPIDPDLRFDVCFYHCLESVEAFVRRFQPDFIHVTSPGDLGLLGAIIADRLRIPLAASWHTNLHEFAARRVGCVLSRVPAGARTRISDFVERFVMDRVCWFFRRAQVLFAPNRELAGILRERTGRDVALMGRGVDTRLFHPTRRSRVDSDLVFGYVGRLMPEKGLRLLPDVADALREAGIERFRFQLAGSGSERGWLERNLPEVTFTGVLTGEALAQAYANADVFLFPSRTDTFGNVVQEALASGVPAVVMNAGGPRFIVRHGVSGIVAADDEEFCRGAATLGTNERLRREMGSAGRRQVEGQSWDRVFEEVYEAYASCRAAPKTRPLSLTADLCT
jgi:glycosyltransferase involved in cell wall biosynthesis